VIQGRSAASLRHRSICTVRSRWLVGAMGWPRACTVSAWRQPDVAGRSRGGFGLLAAAGVLSRRVRGFRRLLPTDAKGPKRAILRLSQRARPSASRGRPGSTASCRGACRVRGRATFARRPADGLDPRPQQGRVKSRPIFRPGTILGKQLAAPSGAPLGICEEAKQTCHWASGDALASHCAGNTAKLHTGRLDHLNRMFLGRLSQAPTGRLAELVRPRPMPPIQQTRSRESSPAVRSR